MLKKYRYWAVKLSGIIILVFLSQKFVLGFTEIFILNSQSWSQPWRFFTAIFLHAGLAHLVLNLFALLLFGSILEKFIGEWRMLGIFIVSGALANLVAVNFYSSSLGASGAIFGIIGALVVIRPMMTIWAFGMPMPLFVAGILWAIADMLGAYGFFIGNPIDSTGNIAHLFGMVFGLIFGALLRKQFRGQRERKERIELDEDYLKRWEEVYMKN